MSSSALAAPSGHAQVVVVSPRDFTNGMLCDESSTLKCVGFNGVGNTVNGATLANASALNEIALFVCTHNGQTSQFVQSKLDGDATNCPFTTPALDKTFDGKEIVELQAHGTSNCMEANSSDGNVYEQSCSHSGVDFVKVPSSGTEYEN